MSDFASAAMFRIMVDGMQSLGLDTLVVNLRPTQGNARVRADLKQRLAASAVQQAGLSCLLKLGRGGRSNLGDPTHRALTSARDAADLLERWGRLERYVHSLHWVEVAELRPGGALLRHLSRAPGAAPSTPEDLVFLGLLLALLESVGLHDVEAEIEGQRVYPEASEPVLQRLSQRARTGTWLVRWQPPAPAFAEPAARPRLLHANVRRIFVLHCRGPRSRTAARRSFLTICSTGARLATGTRERYSGAQPSACPGGGGAELLVGAGRGPAARGGMVAGGVHVADRRSRVCFRLCRPTPFHARFQPPYRPVARSLPRQLCGRRKARAAACSIGGSAG